MNNKIEIRTEISKDPRIGLGHPGIDPHLPDIKPEQPSVVKENNNSNN